MHYILNDAGDPVPESDTLAWAMWFQTAECTIARTELPDGVIVSTVFLGVDHNLHGGRPLLFETMIFNGPLDETQYRYATRQAALVGHEAVVVEAKAASE